MDHAENPVGDRVVGIEFDSLLELCEGFVVAAGGVVGPADGDVDDEREGIERLAVFHLGDGFCVAAHGHHGLGVPVIGRGIGGIEFEAALEFFLSLWPLPVVKPEHCREGSVSFAEIRIELESR